MDTPTFADYVTLISTLFDRFWQHAAPPRHRGHPLVYQHKALIMFFILMQERQIVQFKAQQRWLSQHPVERHHLGVSVVPARTTLSRRYKSLASVVQQLIAFLGQHAADLDPRLAHHSLYTDKSLFKALGPVWHQSDRLAGRIPEKLRHLDTDATWSKSGYHGWVYGYGLHLTCTRSGFPVLAQVETGSVAESDVIDSQAEQFWRVLTPHSVTADNSYTRASRIRRWAQQGVILLTPATKWQKGRYAQAYHRFIQEPSNAARLTSRRTAIEPVFDLVAKVLGTSATQKQLPVQKLPNVRTCLSLAVLTIQLAMIANSIWSVPLRTISILAAVWT